MALQFGIGLDAITSYRRLAYTAWHALAEFVDNSTQAYFDNRDELDAAYAEEGESLWVRIVYDAQSELLRISDNSIGMSYSDLEHAMHVASPPANTSGRCKYGMGLKTAACWIGSLWSVKTKRLGETTEYVLTLDVDQIAAGAAEIPCQVTDGLDPSDHYTIIEVRRHNRKFHGRTLGKIKEFLRSMYRQDFRCGLLTLEWQGVPLEWLDLPLMRQRDGQEYRKDFAFEVDGRRVQGWVGILEHGTRANAGFSIIHCGRVVRGWPDSWRPSTIYGQLQGSNDLINQRLIGEVHLDDFDVSHTKDDILWLGDQEDQVEAGLLEQCRDYRDIAKTPRRGHPPEGGPTDIETRAAVEELTRELESPEAVDTVGLDEVPPQEVIDRVVQDLVATVTDQPATFSVSIGELVVRGFLASDLSPNDPYIVLEAAHPSEVLVIINTQHPHWMQIRGSEGVLNYLRHCTYDGIAEWKARRKAGRIDPSTIKLLKDQLLRLSMEMEMSEAAAEQEDASVPD